MRSWVKKKLVRRYGDSATYNISDAGLIRVDEIKELRQVVAPQPPIHSPSTRDASSSLGVWCWRCRAVDPRHWFRVSTPQIEPLDWTADKCNEICEVRSMVQKLVTRPVTFNAWYAPGIPTYDSLKKPLGGNVAYTGMHQDPGYT